MFFLSVFLLQLLHLSQNWRVSLRYGFGLVFGELASYGEVLMMTLNIPAFRFVQWFSLSVCSGSESFTLGNKAGIQFCPFQSFSLPSGGGSWDGKSEKLTAPEHGAHWCMPLLCPSDPQSENGRMLVCPRDEASPILIQLQAAKEQIPESPHPLDLSISSLGHPQLISCGFSLYRFVAHPPLLGAVSPSGPVLPSLLFLPLSVYSSCLKICSFFFF